MEKDIFDQVFFDGIQKTTSLSILDDKINDVVESINVNGYCRLKGLITDQQISSAKEYLFNSKLTAKQRSTSSKEDFLLDISYDPRIIRIATRFFNEEAAPIQGLLFKYPSEQAIHQDTVHFSTMPRDKMMAYWVALEDVSFDQGPLTYIANTHLLPTFTKYEMPLGGSTSLGNNKNIREDYEKYTEELSLAIKRLKLETFTFEAKAGDAFVWHPRLWHGGGEVINKDKTRYSYVTHYMAKDTPVYIKHFRGLTYLPRFENPRDLATDKPLYKFGILSLLVRFLKLIRS
tara:strand:+ start:4872 stop:5738 length:867 start_codon:yes stop_codon:yes gene_type:complete